MRPICFSVFKNSQTFRRTDAGACRNSSTNEVDIVCRARQPHIVRDCASTTIPHQLNFAVSSAFGSSWPYLLVSSCEGRMRYLAPPFEAFSVKTQNRRTIVKAQNRRTSNLNHL